MTKLSFFISVNAVREWAPMYTQSKRQTEKQNFIRLNLKNGKLWNSCIPAIWKTCLMLHTTRTDGVLSNLKQGRKQTSCNMKNNL